MQCVRTINHPRDCLVTMELQKKLFSFFLFFFLKERLQKEVGSKDRDRFKKEKSTRMFPFLGRGEEQVTFNHKECNWLSLQQKQSVPNSPLFGKICFCRIFLLTHYFTTNSVIYSSDQDYEIERFILYFRYCQECGKVV